MDFHGMKRKDLQKLCKKHGIPGNLKNTEMARRLASLFEMETEDIETETEISPEDSVEADGIVRKVKKVTFSSESENQVFEFTRSAKKVKNVRTRNQRSIAQNLQQGGITLRRSKRSAAKGIAVAGSNGNDSNPASVIVEVEKVCSSPDIAEVQMVPRRSKRIGSRGSTQEDCKVTELIDLEQIGDEDTSKGLSQYENVGRRSTRLAAKIAQSCLEEGTSKAGTLLPAKQPKRLADTDAKEDELVKSNAAKVSVDFEVPETGKRLHDDDSKLENVPRRSRRFVNDIDLQTNTQDQRKSVGVEAIAAKGTKEERKTKRSKGSAEGELVKNRTKEPLIDCEVQKTGKHPGMKAQDVSKAVMVTRHSKRLWNKVNVPMDKWPLVDGNVKNVKCNDLQVEKAPEQSRQPQKSVSELLEDGQAQKGGKQPKRTSGNDHENIKPLRRSKRSADNLLGQAMSKSPNRCSVIDSARDGASVDNVKKLNVDIEMQVRARFTRNSSKSVPFKAARVVEGSLVEKKTDKSVARRMKRDRSAEQEEVGGANVEARGSSKKSKTVNHECNKDKPQGMIEDSPSSSETKAADSVMTTENVLDYTLEKSVDISQRTITQENESSRSVLLMEVMEGEREEKLERDTVLMAAIKEDKENESSRSVLLIERLSPASMKLAVNNPEAELVVPTGNIHVKDIASTVMVEENTKTKDETLICTPRSELKEHSSVAKLAKVKVLENSAECWKEIHSSKYDEKGYLEKDAQASNLHESFSECNTQNNSEEEEMEISKVVCMSVGRCVNLTPEMFLEPEEAGGANVEARGSSKKMNTVGQEFVKDKQQVMAGDSPLKSEAKATEPLMIAENEFDSTLKVPSVISPVRNVQELNSELMEGECEEKHEQDAVLIAVTKKSKEEGSKVKTCPDNNSSAGDYLSVELTPPPASAQLATSNPEAELGVSTGHILAKEIVSTVTTEEDTNQKEETLICTPRSELKDLSSVAKLAKVEAILENSAECCNEIHSSKDNEKGSFEKEIQAENLHGNFSEYKTENGRAEEQADICKGGRISVDHCVNLETLDENLEKSERTISSERGCKRKALELSGYLTDFASLSPMEENVSECVKEDETKALSQPIPINKAASSTLDEPAVFTTPERNLMLMEQLSENGKRRAVDSVTHHNDEGVESHAVVFTTPEQVLYLGDSELDEVGKEEEHTATNLSDVLNSTERYSMLGASRQNEARNEGERIVVELHDDSNIATTPLKQSSVGDFEGDGIERNEENKTVELHCESGTCTTPDRHALLENSGFENPVVFTGLEERHEGFGYSGQDEAREGDVKKSVQFYEEAGLSTGMHKDLPLADPELGEAGWLGINIADKSGPCTSLERQLLYGDFEQKKAVKTAEKAAAEFHDESVVPNIPERYPFPEEPELVETAKSEENKAVELQVDRDIFTCAEKHLFLETEEGMKGDDIIAKSHEMSDVLTASESHSLIGDFEPDEAENKYRENKDVELLSESNISTNMERHLLSEDSGLHGTRKMKDNTSATCEEYFVFTSPEKNQLLGNSELPTAGKQEREVEFKDESSFFTRIESRLLLEESGQDRLGNGNSGSSQYQSLRASSPQVILKDDSVIRESHVAALDFRENTIADSSGSIASKVSDTHEFNAGEEIAVPEFIPKVSQAANVVGLDTIQGISNQSRGNSPHVDSVNLFAFDIEGAETTVEAKRNLYILALAADGNSVTIGEIPSHLEVAGTCSVVSEESAPSTNIQNQINDALEELAITDNNEAAELIEAKVTKNTERDYKGQTCIVGGTEDEHLGCNSEEDFRATCGKSGRKTLEDEATGPIATPFEKAISLTPDEFTVQDNINEEGVDAIQGTSKQSRGSSPHVNSVNLFDFDTEATETIMEAERNVPLGSCVLTLPAEGDFEATGEISSHLEVAGTSSMVSEESAPSTDIQNQINDALEELAITDNNEADEFTEAEVTKNLDSSVSEKTCEKSGRKFLKDEATDRIATAFATLTEKDTSLCPDELTAQNNRNEADEEMIKRETTPSPEENLNESSENRKEGLNIGESGTSSEKQVRREPILIYRTQVKPKRHDMKENAPNSKIVDNLNVTAPRTSKRQPLQDLRKK